jgi:hypothetical protein
VKKAPQVIFLALVACAIAQALWQHGRLPERVATHFNAAGTPNGWMTRDGETAWHVGVVLFMAALFEGIAWAGARLPRELINLPHRDYWLAPERRAATDAWLGGMLRLLGGVLMLFFLGLFHLVYRANLDGAPLSAPATALLTGGLLVTVGLVLAGMFVRFARPPA